MEDHLPVPLDLTRLNARLDEARMPIEIWATVADLARDQAEAIREGRTRPTRAQVQRIAAVLNVSAAYLMGATSAEVPKPALAQPVVNLADVARVHASAQAVHPAPAVEPDPIASNLIEALEIEARVDAFDYDLASEGLPDDMLRLPSQLYGFGLRNRVPLVVLIAIDRIAGMLAPRFEPRSPAQWSSFYAAAVPLARAVVKLSAENGTSFFDAISTPEESQHADPAQP
jgi:hypothetical protein